MDRPPRRIAQIFEEGLFSRKMDFGKKTLNFGFMLSPSSLRSDSFGRVSSLACSKTEFISSPQLALEDIRNLEIKVTKAQEEIDAQLVISCIGFTGESLDSLPTDNSGRFINENGQVAGHPDVFCTSWARTGAHGTLASTIQDVKFVTDHMSSLLLKQEPKALSTVLQEKLLEIDFISYNEWRLIDEAEIERGRLSGKVREKIADLEEFRRFSVNH